MGSMIRHTVLFLLDEDADLAAIAAGLEALVGVVPGLRSLWVGASGSADDTHSLVLISEHDDWAALAVYAEHPAHRAAGAPLRAHLIDRAAVDAEV